MTAPSCPAIVHVDYAVTVQVQDLAIAVRTVSAAAGWLCAGVQCAVGLGSAATAAAGTAAVHAECCVAAACLRAGRRELPDLQ